MPRQTLKQRADGRYRVKYQGKYFYGSTQREAYAARDAYIRALESGLKDEALGATVSAYASKWVVTYKSHLSAASYNTHVRILNRFCEHNNIGSKRISAVDTSDVQSFFNTLQNKSYSSICDARDTIRGLFRSALADRLIIFDPTMSATLPKGQKGTHRAITQHERDLISETEHRLRPAVMTMLYAGLRRGEVLALDVDRDVDFEAMTITVREAVRFVNQNQPEIVDPKTEAGIRTIPLLDILANELLGLHGLVCPSTSGAHMSEIAWKRAWDSYVTALETHANGCHKRWYGKTKQHKAILDANAQLPPWESISIRSHDLRHSFCTMLYDAGVDLKSAMRWMGHADQKMTMQIYTHLSDQKLKAASEALQNTASLLYGGQNGGHAANSIRESIVL